MTSELIRFFTHYGMHFFAPGLIAFIFFREKWIQVWLIFLATMLIDIDHLIATPIFDPRRCSIGFHPLHSYIALGVYVLGLFFRQTRVVAIGLVFHIITDAVDCLWISP